METPCISCGKPLPAEARFCNYCGAPQTSAAKSPSESDEALENRVMTVLFCDLVGSTALSEALDAEDFAALIQRFQTAVAQETRAQDGHVAKFIGDGAMLYFGYPKVVQNAPLRAVRAAKALMAASADFGAGLIPKGHKPVGMRIGIHTGMVIAGRMGEAEFSEERAIVGVTPNIAARLESLAKPGQIVCSAQTRRSIEAFYETTDLGMASLKGLSSPVRAYTIDAAVQNTVRDLSQVHGRDDELATLSKVWEKTAPGQIGRASLVGGPGMGKSTTAARFLQRVERLEEGHVAIFRFAGAHEEANSAYRVLSRFAKREVVADHANRAREAGATRLLASLADPSAVSQNAAMEDTPSQIAEIMVGMINSTGLPTILYIDDRQWLDSATRGVLRLVTSARFENRVMILDTSRSSEDPLPDVTGAVLEIDVLSPDSAMKVVEGIDSNGVVSTAIRKGLIERTGGNPLYLEELTRFYVDRLEAGESVTVEDLLVHGGRLSEVLLARLDALGAMKAVVQRVSVIGDRFDVEEFASVLEDEEDCATTLEELTAGHVLARVDDGTSEGGRYRFWHALVRDVAYGSMLRRHRRPIHAKLAEWILTRDGWRDRWRPEDVARHLSEAEDRERAVPFWLEAAKTSESLGGYEEAIAHAQAALKAIDDQAAGKRGADTLSPETERTLRQKAYAILIPAMIAVRGRIDPSINAAFEEAVPLARQAPDNSDSFSILWCWWFVGQNYSDMNERAKELLQVAKASGSEELLMQSHHCLWAVSFFQGKHDKVRQNVKHGLELYNEARDVDAIARFGGHDAKVCGLGEVALTSWICGSPAESARNAMACIAWADRINHRGSLLHALDYLAVYSLFSGDLQTCEKVTSRWKSLMATAPTEQYTSKIAFFSAWKRGLEKLEPAIVAEMADAVYALAKMGVNEDMPVYLGTLADFCLRAGNLKGAREAIAHARKLADVDGIVFWHPELARLEGEVAAAENEPQDEVMKIFDTAVTQAINQGALMLEARLLDSITRYMLDRQNGNQMRMKTKEFENRAKSKGAETALLMAVVTPAE